MDTRYVELITWLDHQVDEGGWQSLEDAAMLGPLKCVTVGFVVSETRDIVVLAPTYSTASEVTEHMAILKKVIVGRKRIKVTK